MGYVHANNLASRHLVTKLGHVPVRLTAMSYLGEKDALQILYIYPPNLNNIRDLLPLEIREKILKNNLLDNTQVFLNSLSQKPTIELCLRNAIELAQDISNQNFDIPTVDNIFPLIVDGFLKGCLKNNPQDSQLNLLAKKVAFLKDIQKIIQKNEGFFPANGKAQHRFHKKAFEDKLQILEKYLQNS